MALSGDASANRYGVSRVYVSSRWGLGCGDVVRRSRRRRRRRGWKGRNERAAAWNRARVCAEWSGGCKEGRFSAGPRSTLTCLRGEEEGGDGWGRRRRARVDVVEGCNARVAEGERRRKVGRVSGRAEGGR